VRRTGLGRHGGLDDRAGDPLDGLVNLFDIGIVLAVAFLLAGLGLTLDAQTGAVEPREDRAGREQVVTVPHSAPRARGRGDAVGTVFRLPDGRLVLVRPEDEP
jgi:hypothetical protein